VTSKEPEQKRSEGAKRLVDLLQYQRQSIVSSVLLKNQGGTATLFAFGEGESLSEHTAPFDALLNVIEGEANVYIAPGNGGEPANQPEANSHNYRVRAGDIITLPANRAHAVIAVTNFKMLLIMIRA
jgi:quercetin dioxygenase-like cupin family protein